MDEQTEDKISNIYEPTWCKKHNGSGHYRDTNDYCRRVGNTLSP